MLTLCCRAKLNLTLDVLGRRPDGYHELDSVFVSISLADRLEVALGGEGLRLTCGDPALPCDSRNLVHRAARAFLQASGARTGVAIHLEKRIPQAAGLGGGSSDAAGTLVALNRLLGEPLGAGRLHEVAASLGSDVPFFLSGGFRRARGRGERLEPIRTAWDSPAEGAGEALGSEPASRSPALWFALVKPPFGVDTAWAYRQLGTGHRSGEGTSAMLEALASGDPRRVARALSNDLQEPVFRGHPELLGIRGTLLSAGALGALMSGSGSTVFGVFAEEADAERAAAALRGPEVWAAVARPTPTALGTPDG